MSITPVDKPPDREERGPGASRRSAVRKSVGRFFAWVRERVSAVLPSVEDREPALTVGSTPSTDAGEAARPAVATKGSAAVSTVRERDHPLTYPGRDLQGTNPPDVVSTETDDGLRISVPDNPDATLTSDVWTTVDP